MKWHTKGGKQTVDWLQNKYYLILCKVFSKNKPFKIGKNKYLMSRTSNLLSGILWLDTYEFIWKFSPLTRSLYIYIYIYIYTAVTSI